MDNKFCVLCRSGEHDESSHHAGVRLMMNFSVEEARVIMHRLSGPDGFLAKRLEELGMLPDNHEQIAFEMEEGFRKLLKKEGL